MDPTAKKTCLAYVQWKWKHTKYCGEPIRKRGKRWCIQMSFVCRTYFKLYILQIGLFWLFFRQDCDSPAFFFRTSLLRNWCTQRILVLFILSKSGRMARQQFTLKLTLAWVVCDRLQKSEEMQAHLHRGNLTHRSEADDNGSPKSKTPFSTRPSTGSAAPSGKSVFARMKVCGRILFWFVFIDA